MKIEQILKSVEQNIGEICEFTWSSLGKSKIWDVKNIQGTVVGGFVANKAGDVLMVDFDKTYGDSKVFYRWVAPSYKVAYLAERSEKARDLNTWVDLEDEADCLEKINAVVKMQSFDPRVVTPINLSDEDFLTIAKMAHAANITFNDQVNVILSEFVNLYGKPINSLPVFGGIDDKKATHVVEFKE